MLNPSSFSIERKLVNRPARAARPKSVGDISRITRNVFAQVSSWAKNREKVAHLSPLITDALMSFKSFGLLIAERPIVSRALAIRASPQPPERDVSVGSQGPGGVWHRFPKCVRSSRQASQRQA